jgi:predicted peptidase
MRRIFLVTMLLGGAMSAFPHAVRAADAGRELYEANTYRDSGGRKLPYRLLKPEKIERGKRYPLVLFLHGIGERGTDNMRQLLWGAGEFAKAENRQKYPCFVVAPQCPPTGLWVGGDLKELLAPNFALAKKPTQPMRLVLELIDKLVAGNLPIDKNRLYVTGLSMGGFGTWDLIERRPRFFAAAIPICGRGDPVLAAKLKNLPIWVFHGGADPIVPFKYSKEMVAAIRQAGGTPKLTIYPDVGHDSWSATYANRDVLAWLFAQKRKK